MVTQNQQAELAVRLTRAFAARHTSLARRQWMMPDGRWPSLLDLCEQTYEEEIKVYPSIHPSSGQTSQESIPAVFNQERVKVK